MSLTVGELIQRSARQYPHKEAIVFEGKRFTYCQLNDRVNRLANGLSGIGVQKGDKVALLLYNGNEIIESYLAAAKIGAIPVAINYRFVTREIQFILENADASVLIFHGDFLASLSPIMENESGIHHFCVVGEGSLESCIPFETLVTQSPAREPVAQIIETDTCNLMYTGGTTGFPKGCEITHGNILWFVATTLIDRRFTETDVYLICLPMYHAIINIVLSVLAAGGTNVVTRTFDPEEVVTMIEKEGVTSMTLVPTMVVSILETGNISQYNLSSVTRYFNGAAAFPLDIKEKAKALFPYADIYDPYGQTEATSASISILKPEDAFRKIGSVGRASAFGQVRVVDETGHDVDLDEVGEIIFQGPTVMKGYYKNNLLTAETIRNGWLHTGDLAQVDDEGYVYIVARQKDMIVSGGLNIYPAEIEQTLCRHSKIKEACVFGVPHKRWGEAVKAVVALKESCRMDKAELIEYCCQEMAGFKKPRYVAFVAQLPKNPIGKILKKEIQNTFGFPNDFHHEGHEEHEGL